MKMLTEYENFCRNPNVVNRGSLRGLCLSAEADLCSRATNFKAARSINPALDRTILRVLTGFQGRN